MKVSRFKNADKSRNGKACIPFKVRAKQLRKEAAEHLRDARKLAARRNPDPREEIARAKQLHRDFSGHEATHGTKVRFPQLRTALQVGQVDGLMYTAKRDGKTLRYFHKFAKTSRPLLVANFDGSSVAIVGGRYRFTDRGIVDT